MGAHSTHAATQLSSVDGVDRSRAMVGRPVLLAFTLSRCGEVCGWVNTAVAECRAESAVDFNCPVRFHSNVSQTFCAQLFSS